MDWTFIQIGLVVEDIEGCKENWRKLLGREPFVDGYCPPFEDTPTFSDGQPCDCSDVRFIKFMLDDKHIVALFKPGKLDNPWKKFHDEHGDGFMFAEFKTPDVKQAYRDLGAALGIDRPYHYGLYPQATYTLADTRKQLGFQLNICADEDNAQSRAQALNQNKNA